MEQQKISVIVPVYNVAPYLHKCVDSLLAQTYPDLEIILVDDGSTDGSERICDEYAGHYPHITVIHQKNAGQAVARNAGLDAAAGEWIGFLDSDDWIEEDMYETLLSLAQTHGADLVSCSTRQLSVDGEILSLSDTGKILTLTPDEMIAGLVTQEIVRFEIWNKLWKRSLIGDVRFIKGQLCEEVYFDRLLFLKANKMVHIDLPLHNYLVKRPGSTATSFKLARFCIFDEFDALIQDLEARGKSKLADMVRWVAVTFSYGIYCEAVDTKQNAEVKDKLLQWFVKYYDGRKDKDTPFVHKSTKIKMRLFRSCPGSMICLRKLRDALCK
nr:glycosyltransferase [uncultured Oscillibacter sp.]